MKINQLFQDEEINISSYLLKHGITDIEEFINPSGKYLDHYSLYKNMNEAVNVTKYHLELDLTIGILVDVDFDGYSSCTILYSTLKSLFPNCKILIFLHDDRKMHGLRDEIALDKILNNNINLLFTPDSASGDYEQHEILRNHEIYHIALDHHATYEKPTPSIIVNNQFSDVNKDGSGGLVTFKFCQALCDSYGNKNANKYTDLVYASLVSDIMDMSSMENAVFRKFGMIKNKMLQALCDKYIKDGMVCDTVMSFKVVPKLSAIIRSQNEDVKKKLLLALFNEREEDIQYVIDNCDKIHKQQNDIVKEYFEEYVEKVNADNNIIFEPIDIYPFYTGLIGSKLVNKFNKPTLLYRQGKSGYSGSIRSPIGVKDTLKESGLFTFVEGHDKACGCGFKEIKDLQLFVKDVIVDDNNNVCKSYQVEEIPNELFSLASDYIHIWGNGIPKPLFHIYNIYINSNEIIEKKGATIKFSYKGVEFLHFFTSNKMKEDLCMDKSTNIVLEVLGTLELNEWRGKVSKQVLIEKIECSKVDVVETFEDLF